MTLEFSRHMSPAAKKVLVGRALAALDPANDARGLTHEFRAATAFAHKGWDIEFVDFENRGTFDFLVRRAADEIEVECKCVTGDLGNAVHNEHFDTFANEFFKRIRNLKSEHAVCIDVALTNRLPNTFAERRALLNAAVTVLEDGQSQSVSGTRISRREIDQQLLDSSDVKGSANRLMRQIQEERNGSIAASFESGFIAIHAYSERAPRVAESVRETIEQASSQFTKTRPSIVWTHFAALTNSELVSLAESYEQGTPTALQAIAYKMFQAAKHDHVAGLLYTGGSTVNESGKSDLIIHPVTYAEGGSFYPVWNANCRFNQPFREIDI